MASGEQLEPELFAVPFAHKSRVDDAQLDMENGIAQQHGVGTHHVNVGMANAHKHKPCSIEDHGG